MHAMRHGMQDFARLRLVNEVLERAGLNALEEYMVHDLTSNNRHFIHEGDLKLRNGDKTTDIHAILLTDMLLFTHIKDDSRLALKA